MSVKIPRKKRAVGRARCHGDCNLVLKGGARRCQHPDQVRFPVNPQGYGIRRAVRPRCPKARPASAVNVQNASSTCTCAMETVSGPSLNMLCDDEPWLQRDPLKAEALDRRIAVAAQRVCWSPLDDHREQHTEKDERQQGKENAAHHERGASARNKPIHPNSANSLWCA